MGKVFKIILISVAILGISGTVAIIIINESIKKTSAAYIHSDLNEVPASETALVLGARVYENGRLSDIFKDRVNTAIALYEAGKVKKILISGDHGSKEYDEVNAAKDYIIGKVSQEDIFLDHAGFDTYDSLYRAIYIFKTEDIVVVTQDFHLPRAVYIGNKLGANVHGMSADLHLYSGAAQWEFREFLARVKAWIDVSFSSKPKYLGKEIPINGDASASWD